LKGCVQGYGNYKELTSSGVDPTELFDDVEDSSSKSPDLLQPDIVIEECNDVVEEGGADQENIKSPDHVYLLPTEKARRRVRLRHSESNADPTFDSALDGGSIYTAPSLYSLVSMPNEFEENKMINVVTDSCCVFVIQQQNCVIY